MNVLIEELSRRWCDMFDALARGEDLPPAVRLRTEGVMEAAVLLGIEAEEALQSRLAACYLDAFGKSLEADFGPGWRDFYAFPQIPAVARRAPVYPSTKD